MKEDIVIIAAQRTPIGSFCGTLKNTPAPEIGAAAIRGTVQNSHIDPLAIDQVLMGCVFQGGVGQAPARQAALYAGLSEQTSCTSVNKVCASGMKAVMQAVQSLRCGDSLVSVAGGMENMSAVPHYMLKGRTGHKFGDMELVDGLLLDGLTDAFSSEHMGICGEICAEELGITRAEQDQYASESYRRAQRAWEKGLVRDEIAPVEIIDPKTGEKHLFNEDEEYRNVRFDKIPNLGAAFKKGGTITAANASTLNDGAAVLLLTTEEHAQKLGVKPIARVISYADAAQDPRHFPTSPVAASQAALTKAGLTVKDIDYWEVNEAFAVVALANIRLLGLDPSRVNVLGGSVSLGHPLGASGARIIVTLLNVLEKMGGRYGCASICNGGGGASAMIFERITP